MIAARSPSERSSKSTSYLVFEPLRPKVATSSRFRPPFPMLTVFRVRNPDQVSLSCSKSFGKSSGRSCERWRDHDAKLEPSASRDSDSRKLSGGILLGSNLRSHIWPNDSINH